MVLALIMLWKSDSDIVTTPVSDQTSVTTTTTTRASLQNNTATSGVNCTSVRQLLLEKGGVCVFISQAVQMQVWNMHHTVWALMRLLGSVVFAKKWGALHCKLVILFNEFWWDCCFQRCLCLEKWRCEPTTQVSFQLLIRPFIAAASPTSSHSYSHPAPESNHLFSQRATSTKTSNFPLLKS